MKDFPLQHKNETLYNSHNTLIFRFCPFKINALEVFLVEAKKRNYSFTIISFFMGIIWKGFYSYNNSNPNIGLELIFLIGKKDGKYRSFT